DGAGRGLGGLGAKSLGAQWATGRKPGHPAVRVGARVLGWSDRLAVNPQARTRQRIRQGGIPDFQAPGLAPLPPSRGRAHFVVHCSTSGRAAARDTLLDLGSLPARPLYWLSQ